MGKPPRLRGHPSSLPELHAPVGADGDEPQVAVAPGPKFWRARGFHRFIRVLVAFPRLASLLRRGRGGRGGLRGGERGVLAEPLDVDDGGMRVQRRLESVRREPRLGLGLGLARRRRLFVSLFVSPSLRPGTGTRRRFVSLRRLHGRRPRVRFRRVPGVHAYPTVEAPGDESVQPVEFASDFAKQTRDAFRVLQHLNRRPVPRRIQYPNRVRHGPEVGPHGECDRGRFRDTAGVLRRVQADDGVDASPGASVERPDALPRSVVLRQHALTLRPRQP